MSEEQQTRHLYALIRSIFLERLFWHTLQEESIQDQVLSSTNREMIISEHERKIDMRVNQLNVFATALYHIPLPNIAFNIQSNSRPFHLKAEKRVAIIDLTHSIDRPLYGKFLLCRTIAIPFMNTETMLHTIVEDPEGVLAVRLLLVNFIKVENPEANILREILPAGTILAIRNPWFKTVMEGMSVRAENSEDVLFVDDNTFNTIFPDVTWKGELHPQFGFRNAANTPPMPETSEDFFVFGDMLFEKELFVRALQAYVEGLKLSPHHIGLLLSRSATHLKMGNYRQAAEDAEEVLKIDAHNLKAKYYKANALIRLRKYPEALNLLSNLDDPKNTDWEVYKSLGVGELRDLLQSQMSGVYNMESFVNFKYDRRFNDCAEYIGPIKLQQIENKGRGFVATENILTGQLILTSRALAYDEDVDKLVRSLSQQLETNPEMGKDLYSLYAGPELGFFDLKTEDDYGEVDTKRIEAICKFNAFHLNAKFKDDFAMTDVVGLFQYPSYINHSCAESNSFWICHNDFMFVRATKDIAVGEEVLISYVHPSLPYGQRIAVMEALQFKCNCKLCSFEQNDSEIATQKRENILQLVEENLETSSKTKVKKYYRELKNMRPNGEPDFFLSILEIALSRYFFASSNYEKVIELMEKTYVRSKTTQDCPLALEAAINMAKAYAEINQGENVTKSVLKWKQMMQVVYGAERICGITRYRNIERNLIEKGFVW